MTDIRFLKDRVVFDGHAQSIEECDTITTVCDVLKNSSDFKTVRYENGYAEFERVGTNKELKFAPSIMDITINFDSNISKVTFADAEWSSSGETISVAVTTQSLFTVTLSNGYVINSVTTDDTSSLGEVTDITDNTFKIEQIASLGATTITITSKQAVTTNIPAGYFTWNGEKRLVHADDLYNSDGTKKKVGATFVEITSPSSASNGTLTQEQLDTLTASKNNKIIFDNEIYYCEDVQHDSGFLVYAHVGRDSAGNTFVKSIGITISTRGWVKVDLKIASTDYVDNKINSAIVTTLNTEV